MKKSILVALKNSASSAKVVEFVAGMPFNSENFEITLLNVFRKPSQSEEMMGEEFFREEPQRLKAFMENAKDKFLQNGYRNENVHIKLVMEPYPTVADGIIDQFNKKKCWLVVIGRRKKSKSEEFVMGDVSVKLIRALDETAVLVVKSK